MRITLAASTAAMLVLAACGPAPSTPQADAKSDPPKAEPKCPDPSIKDPNNPRSPNHYKPVKGTFKGQKSF